MKIICHRGDWNTSGPQNSMPALLASKKFDGIEIDLKNQLGEVVISHDPILTSEALPSLKAMIEQAPELFFALNIKEDGLGPGIKSMVGKNVSYMCFDLSSPEAMKYKALGLNVFDRYGDNDPHSELSAGNGFVIDVFDERNWSGVLENLIHLKAHLFFISPELHGQKMEDIWELIRKFSSRYKGELSLCTDFPGEANLFFNRTAP